MDSKIIEKEKYLKIKFILLVIILVAIFHCYFIQYSKISYFINQDDFKYAVWLLSEWEFHEILSFCLTLYEFELAVAEFLNEMEEEYNNMQIKVQGIINGF